MSNAVDLHGSFWGPLLVMGQIGLFTLVLLISIAFLLLLDRKVWAGVMMRKGPNVVGPFGLLQSFADFGKFLLKEIVIPAGASKTVFILAPILTCTLAFAAWAAIPVSAGTEPARIGSLQTSMSAYSISSRSPRWGFTASSWAAGLPTRNTPSSAPCAARRKWCPMKSRSVSLSSR